MSHKHICFALLLMPALKCCATVCGQFANLPFPYSPSNVVILLALTVSLTNLMQILHSLLNIFVVSIFSLYSVLFSIRFFFCFLRFRQFLCLFGFWWFFTLVICIRFTAAVDNRVYTLSPNWLYLIYLCLTI